MFAIHPRTIHILLPKTTCDAVLLRPETRLQGPKRRGPRRVGEHSAHLLADALAADAAQIGRVPPDRPLGRGINGEIEACREADSAEGTEMIFGEALLGIANGAQHAPAQVF